MTRKPSNRSRLIKFRGKTKTLAEWSRITGLDRNTIQHRIEKLEWSTKRALTERVESRAKPKRGTGLTANELRNEHRRERREHGLCIHCAKPADGFYACKECRDKRASYRRENAAAFKRRNRKYGERYKREAISHYGNKCACCGEKHPAFLTLDHVNNDGAQHRKKIGRCGTNFYQWLITNGFPEEYELQVLCFNCNQGRRVNGGVCPHQQGRRARRKR